MARPTEYNDEILEKAKQYLQGCKDKEELPQVAELAIHLDIARKTVYAWAEKHEEFCNIVEDVLSMQESRLINRGLSGQYNASITKLLLVKHNYRDAQDTDLTSKGEKLEVVPLLANVKKDVQRNDSTSQDTSVDAEDSSYTGGNGG